MQTKSSIFIPGNTPSSKNSKQWTGKYFIHSKTCQKYYKFSESFWKSEAQNFIKLLQNKQKPYKVEFTFIRNSRRKFDYVNPLQTVLDQMVKYGWIEDDNCDIILPSFGEYSYDKNNPGVYIKVL